MTDATDTADMRDNDCDSNKSNPDSPSEPETTILLFDTTHASMAAEEAIIDSGFWCDVVPKPPDAMTGLCGLAIEIRITDLEAIRATLMDAGLVFEVYRPEVEAH